MEKLVALSFVAVIVVFAGVYAAAALTVRKMTHPKRERATIFFK